LQEREHSGVLETVFGCVLVFYLLSFGFFFPFFSPNDLGYKFHIILFNDVYSGYVIYNFFTYHVKIYISLNILKFNQNDNKFGSSTFQ